MHSLPRPGATSAALILIVSSNAAERERLRRCVPSDVAVHCAATQEEALDLLVADTASTGVAPRLATVSSGVRLMPDGVLVDGVAVRLTPLEHAMLLCLLSPPGSVWSFLALSQQVWGTSFVGDGAQVRAVLKRLRRKLVAAGADLRIESVRGRGLRLAVGTEALSAPAPQLPHNCPITAPVRS